MAIYELDDGLKYTHPFATDAAVGRDYSDLTPAPPQATTARGAPSPAEARWENVRLAGCAQLDLRSGGRMRSGYWDPQTTLLPSKFMIDFVASAHRMFTTLENRLAALEARCEGVFVALSG